MGIKFKKAMKKHLEKATAKLSVLSNKTEGGPARKLPEQPLPQFYIGRIPQGFYKKQMQGFFGQFSTIKKLRIARNKRTGRSKHFGFTEFESPEEAKIVAMHNYLLYEHLLQVYLIPPEHVDPKLWRGFNYRYKPLDSAQFERKRYDKVGSIQPGPKKIKFQD